MKTFFNSSFFIVVKQILVICAFFFANLDIAYSQNFAPLELAKHIFDKNGFPMIRNYITDEYKGHPNGKEMPKNVTKKFILLSQNTRKAVVAMTVSNPAGNSIDMYLYFKKDVLWKMGAIRSLAMAGLVAYEKFILEKLTSAQIDSIIAVTKSGDKNAKYAMFSSKEEFEFKLGNARAIISSDEKLINFFKENKNEFERIKELIIENKKHLKNDSISLDVIENVKHDYKKLFISFISSKNYDFKNCVEFVIGGIGDNTVGYVYSPDKRNLPEMSDDRIIMIREIGDGWYLYKTT